MTVANIEDDVSDPFFSTADPSSFLTGSLNILQSDYWAKFQQSLGEKVFSKDCGSFSYVAIKKETPVGPYLFLPYGPYLANYNCLEPAIEELKKLGKKESAVFVRIEPVICFSENYLNRFGAIKSKEIDPADTWVVELPDKPEDMNTIFARRLRGYYNSHKKNGIEIIKSHNPDDAHYLSEMQKKIFSSKSVTPYSEDYFRKQLAQDFSTLYLAKYNEKIIAAVLVFDDDETRYYMQAASDKEYSKLNSNGILTIQAILDARDKGLLYFDFWGIAPDGADKNHPWYGFTSFKKMFKGTHRHYSGTYDIPIKRLRYQMYKCLRAINRKYKIKQ